MKWPKTLLAALMAASFLFASGCAPARELKDMDIVEGLGVDLLSDGRYQVTYQVFQSQTETGGEEVNILQTTAADLFDASRNISAQSGKRLYYSNLRALVLGSSLCRKGIDPILDFFSRNHELRMSEYVFMAEGRAADILTAKNENGVITARTLEEIAQRQKYNSKVANMQLGELLERVSTSSDTFFLPTVIHRQYVQSESSLSSQAGSSPGAYPANKTSSSQEGGSSSKSGSGVSSGSGSSGSSTSSGQGSSSDGGSEDLQNKGVLEVDRTAVFDEKGRFAAFLDDSQARGFLWTRSGAVRGAVMLTLSKGNVIGIEVKNNSCDLSVGQDAYTFRIKVSGNVVEEEKYGYDLDSPKILSRLETLLGDEVKQELQSAINVAFYGSQSDIFRIGSNYFRFRPEEWRKMSADWPRSGQKLKDSIQVEASVVPHS